MKEWVADAHVDNNDSCCCASCSSAVADACPADNLSPAAQENTQVDHTSHASLNAVTDILTAPFSRNWARCSGAVAPPWLSTAPCLRKLVRSMTLLPFRRSDSIDAGSPWFGTGVRVRHHCAIPRSQSTVVSLLNDADSASITSFLGRIQRPAVTRLTNEELDAFASSDSVVFIAHLGRDDGSTASRLPSLADAYRDRYSFGVAQGSLSDQSTLQCHNNEDGMQHRRVDFDHPGALEALLATCAEPLIPEMSRRNELKYTQVGRPLVVVPHVISPFGVGAWRARVCRLMR